ncbi:MAG: NUDIX hydrolase [Candidatus Methanofastidiosa archaeon]|nr:NUDIX hydrolase [Candidatus Methanofastidiosa archaeon]
MLKNPGPLLAVDGVLTDGRRILLIRRKNPPFQGSWALPGGFVTAGETVEAAVIREIREETGIVVFAPVLVGVFSNPSRDPRGHVVSCAFVCNHTLAHFTPGSDASEARLFGLDELPEALAFDHKDIISSAKRLINGSGYFTSIK